MATDHGNDTPIEVELKLTASPEAMRKIAAASTLRQRVHGRTAGRQLVSVYYDTSDHRLKRRGIALRVRKIGRRLVQTVKVDIAGSDHLTHGEWESDVATLQPDLDAITDHGLRDRLGLILPGDLRPVFTSRFKRRTRLLHEADEDGVATVIEMALDEGHVVVGRDRTPIGEIELELLRGAPAALYRIALALHAIAPLHVGTESKAARGYRLASGVPPAARKSEPVRLNADDSVDDALYTILHSCVSHWLANEAAAVDGRDVEGVHQMRIALRRMRSAFSVFRNAIPPAGLAPLAADAKWAINSLGGARDRDVFLAEMLAPLQVQEPDDTSLIQLERIMQADRLAAYDDARAAIASPRYTAFLLGLCAWIEERGWREQADATTRRWQQGSIADLGNSMLAKRHKAVLKRGRHFARLGSVQRHEVRIALKKLRYTTEFFESLHARKRVRPYRKDAAALQDSLGHLNDVAVAETMMHEVMQRHRGEKDANELPFAAGHIIGWYARALKDVEPEIVDSWRAFAHRRPFWQD